MDEKTKYGLVIGILVIIVIALASCQMAGGLCRDIESAAKYGADHIQCDQRD